VTSLSGVYSGHSQFRCYGTSMSAPPSTADIRQGNGYVSFVPTTDLFVARFMGTK